MFRIRRTFIYSQSQEIMNLKKSNKSNLENKRGLFRDLGLVLGVLLAYGLMTWQFSEGKVLQFTATGEGATLDSMVVIPPSEPPKPVEPITDPTHVNPVDDPDIEIPEITFKDMGDTDSDFQILEKVNEFDTEVHGFTAVEALPYLDGCEDISTNDERWLCSEAQIRQIINEEFVIPSVVHELGINGRAWVSFIIEADGTVSNVEIARTSGEESIDREAVRTVRTLPNFTPAKINGRSVRMSYNVPISVKIN